MCRKESRLLSFAEGLAFCVLGFRIIAYQVPSLLFPFLLCFVPRGSEDSMLSVCWFIFKYAVFWFVDSPCRQINLVSLYHYFLPLSFLYNKPSSRPTVFVTGLSTIPPSSFGCYHAASPLHHHSITPVTIILCLDNHEGIKEKELPT